MAKNLRTLLLTLAFTVHVTALQATDGDAAATLDELRQMVLAQNQVINELREKVSALEEQIGESPAARQSQQVAAILPAEGRTPKPVETKTPSLPEASKTTFLSKFPMQFYGYIKLDAAYDTHRGNNGNIFSFALPKKNGSDDEFNMTARQSRLGVKISGPTFSGWKIDGRLEGDFYGGGSENSFVPRARYAQITLENEDWLIVAGQSDTTWQLYQPDTLNYALGANQGALWTRRSKASLERKLINRSENKLSLLASAGRTVSDDADLFGHEDGKDAGFPTIFGAVSWETKSLFGRPLEIIAGGHWGRESIENAAGDHTNYDTPMVTLNFRYGITDTLIVIGGVWSGENTDGYGGGIGQGVNLLKGTSIAAQGGFFQFQWQTTEKVAIHLFAGVDNPKDGDLNDKQRSMNRNITGTLYYAFIPSLKWGIEYGWTKTDYLNDNSADSHRIQSSLIWLF